MSGERFDVAVVGAGVGGAAFALALASRFDLRVVVLERHAGAGNLNRGDSLLPASTRHLAGWGALPGLRAAGASPVDRMEVHDPGRGLVFAAPLPSTAHAPYLVLPHPSIERALAEAAGRTGRVEVRYGERVVGLVEERDRVRGVVREARKGRGRIEARLVVGADGASSRVRRGLGIALPRRPYPHAYYGVEVERPPGYVPAMRIELSSAGGVLVVPSPDPGRIGLGVLVHPGEHELFRAGTDAVRLEAIRRRSPFLAECRAPGPGSHLYRLARAHAPRYVARGAALLGDAVHVVDPTAGQGMTMAIEDAAALARWAGPTLASGAGDDALDRALEGYEAERRPANARSLAASEAMSRVYAMTGPAGDRTRRAIFRLGATAAGRSIHRWIWSRVAVRGDAR